MIASRCLGLVGGLGVGATVHYYRELANAHEARDRTLDIVIVNAEVTRVFGYLQADDRDGLAVYLVDFIRRLGAAGAEFAAIPAVTPHFCIRELMALSPLPLFNLFDPLNQELAARRIRRASVFGTRYVMESGLFGLAGDVDLIQPLPEEVETIHSIYVDLARTGQGTEEQSAYLTTLAHRLLDRDRAEAIILAGTDLSVFFNEYNTGFPVVDCAALHLKRILKGMTERAESAPIAGFPLDAEPLPG